MSNLATITTNATDQTRSVSTQAMVFDPEIIAGMQRMATMMADARVTIPKHLQGNPADCLAIIMQAAQFGVNPFAMAQKTHIVNGTLGYEAQLVNAVIANSGAIRGRFHYEYRGTGANIECRVGAIPSGESDVVWGEWLSAASVTTKNSPLWKTNPRQQLGYLQVKNWARHYTPGAIMGVYTADELREIPERDMGQAAVVETLNDQLKRNVEPAPDLDDVLSAIASAETIKDLLTAAKLAVNLASEDDKMTARNAYADRKAALEAQDSAADPVAQILAGIAKHDPADLDIWLDEAREQGLSAEDVARVEAAIEARKAS